MTELENTVEKQEWVRPLNGMVVVLPLAERREETVDEGGLAMDLRKSEGGVYIPDNVDQEAIEGLVVAVGAGASEVPTEAFVDALVEQFHPLLRGDGWETKSWLREQIREIAANLKRPMDVKIGDKVLVDLVHATTVVLDGVSFNIVPEDAILGVLQ